MSELATVNIAPEIFKRGKLLFASFHIWPGTAVQSEEDLAIQGATHSDKSLFKPGQKVLIPKNYLEGFTQCRSSYTNQLNKESIPSPLPAGVACRMIPLERMAATRDILLKCEAEMEDLKIKFLAEYPKIREERCKEFDDKHPAHAGAFAKFYPSEKDVEAKFGFDYLFTEVSDLQGLDDVIREERDNTRRKMVSYAEDLAAHFRQMALNAALAFRRGMERAKTTVDSRAVSAFKDFLSRFKQANIMEDEELGTMLESMKQRIFQIEKWEVGDEVNGLRSQLDEVIAMAEREGVATQIADTFIENMGDHSPITLLPAPEVSDIHFG